MVRSTWQERKKKKRKGGDEFVQKKGNQVLRFSRGKGDHIGKGNKNTTTGRKTQIIINSREKRPNLIKSFGQAGGGRRKVFGSGEGGRRGTEQVVPKKAGSKKKAKS